MRAAAIIIENGHVLFAGNDVEDYFYSIGGAVQIGESAEQAVLREVLEETGVAYQIDRLAFVQELFFKGEGGSLDGLDCHEINFFYLMKPKGNQELFSHSKTLNGTIEERMVWLPVDKLSEFRAFPTFLKEKLSCLKPYVEHIVTVE